MYEGILIEPNGGKINLSEMRYINSSYTIKGMKKDLVLMFDNLGVNVNDFTVNISSDSLRQVDPWTIEVQADIYYDFEDKSKIVSWSGLTEKTVRISTYGIYSFDYPDGSNKAMRGPITNQWIVDAGPRRTEPSIINKMSNHLKVPDPGLGLCSPAYNFNGKNCGSDGT
jgi:hypothetical protein